mgnify:FL=1
MSFTPHFPDLTPVDEYNGIFYKRDDFYAPYENFITGGKIRQCRDLVEKNLDYIHDKCNSTISTAAPIHSPQSPIVSRVAQEFGLKSIIGFGNTTIEKALKHKMMQKCKELGSELVVLSESQGFNNVLYHNLHKLSETTPMFKILFGYAAQSHRESIITRIAEQIENVDCDVLYVPVGSGVTLSGILEGVKMFQKQFKVIGLQPFGHDRRKTIHGILEGMIWEYDYDFKMGKYSYNKLLKKNIVQGQFGFDLDMVYESKSYDMIEFDKGEKSCFWCIGNSNLFR